jgi:hypothetical protein
MSNSLSAELKAQIFKQESEDPFLTLVTLTGPGFVYRLVNNSVDIVSNGNTFTAFPMKIRLPADDGESARDFQIDFDNASLLLITALRSVIEPIECKIEMILASMPDTIQSSVEDLLIRSVTYDDKKISARIVLDNFLTVAMTSERYTPLLYPGIF